jgi:hypothetical protein
MKQQGFRYCKRCHDKLRANGFQPNGKKRWRCLNCGTARIQRRKDVTDRNRLQGLVSYLLGSQKRAAHTTRSSATRHDADYWDVIPTLLITGEIYDCVVLDATSVGCRVVAIIRSLSHCLVWQYGLREQSELWSGTLAMLPRPRAVVCDGQKGILKALREVWPGIIIQRCHVHVRRNIRVKLTLHPQSQAGQDLQRLMRRLSAVKTEEDMLCFTDDFTKLYDRHEPFLKEKTRGPNPKGRHGWWYTHREVRSAYQQLDELIRSGQLFAYIVHPQLHIPNQTNYVEGGINSPLKELLHRHRGLTQDRQERLTDWYLDSRTEFPHLKRKPK